MDSVLVFRNVAITTDYANFFPVLQEYGDKERLSRREICARLGLGPGQADRIFHDAKLLKLLDAQWRILPLGRQWVRDVRTHGRPSPETLRAAALNVPLFLETYHALGDTTDADAIFDHFVQRTVGNPREQDVGSARRRYLEGVLHLSIPRSIPVRQRAAPSTIAQAAPLPAPGANDVPLQRAIALVTAYQALMQEYGRENVAACHAALYEKKQ